MHEEIEVKFLEVNVPKLEEQLRALGAVKIGEFLYKRKSYDYLDRRLAAKHGWVRLRDEGNRITLAYKQRFDVGDNILRDGGMHEVEVVVSDFEEVDRLLKAIGLLEKFYEENRRIRYVLGSLTFDIDMWPLLKPYLEIEGDTWENVEKISEKLGFSWEDHLRCSTMQVYEKEGINENDYAVLTFEQQIKKHL